MPPSTSLLASTHPNNTTIFSAFRFHANAPRLDTKTTLLNLLRDAYAEYHITEVNERRISLLDFAAAGKAESVLDAEDDACAFNATREWSAVGEGVEKKVHPGKLKDEFRLARFQYIWNELEFIVYYATWQDPFKSTEYLSYVLYPRSDSNVVAGHCAETDALLLAVGKWTSQLHEEIYVFDDGGWEKSRELWKSVNGSSWDDVILDPEMKKGLIEDVNGFFDNQEVYKSFAVPWKRGVILHGIPGNGKTVSIKALMSALHNRPDSIPSMYVKSIATNCNTQQYAIRQIFQAARRTAPCLLIFEDLDSLVNDDNIRSYFLNEVDGLESNDGILMIGSTNHLDKLDPAISKRPSRFDRKYHFKIPGEEERKQYAKYWRTKLLQNETVDFPEEMTGIIAQLTEGFSFAYLKELFVMALLSLVRGINTEDFEVVDKRDAESSNDEKEKEDDASTEQPQDTCTCATKCNTCHKPLPKPTDANAKKSPSTDDATQPKPKATVPTVDTPTHLANNTLLKVVKHQIRILLAEMDNTKDEKSPDKLGAGIGSEEAVNRAEMRKLMRANRARRG